MKRMQNITRCSETLRLDQNLTLDTWSMRPRTSMARSKREVTFSPIWMAWTEKLHKCQNDILWRGQKKKGSMLFHISLIYRCICFIVLVINVTDERKMVMLLPVYANFVKWSKNFSNFWNPCMFKYVINFREPALKFFSMQLKFWSKNNEKQPKSWCTCIIETASKRHKCCDRKKLYLGFPSPRILWRWNSQELEDTWTRLLEVLNNLQYYLKQK